MKKRQIAPPRMVAGRISRSQNTHSKSAKRNTETWDGPLGIRCWPGKTHLCLLEVSSALGRQPHGTNCRLSRRLSTVTALRCTTWNPGATPPLCRSLGKDNFFFLGERPSSTSIWAWMSNHTEISIMRSELGPSLSKGDTKRKPSNISVANTNRTRLMVLPLNLRSLLRG